MNWEELDVSHNPALLQLECGSNDLKELNVTHNPKLVHLNYVHCNISTLNQGDKPELYRLDCHRNKLTNVDLSDCPKLNDVYYDEGVEVLGLPEDCYVITPYVETSSP